MPRNAIRAAVVSGAAAVLAITGSGLSSAATDTQVAPSASTVTTNADGTSTAKSIGLVKTFSHSTSVNIYNTAKSAGAAAAGAACAAAGGGAAGGIGCAAVAQFALDELTSPPKAGRCLHIVVLPGVPIKAKPSLVDC